MREGTVERRLATHAHPNGIAPARAACTSPRARRAGSAPGSARRRIVVGPGLLRTWRGGSRPGRTRDLGCAPERSIVDAYRLRHLEGDELDRARYFALQRLARQQGRDTQELLTLYALEGLLARLAASHHREQLVVKGGMLLAAFAQRRPTRDLDVHAKQLESDIDTIRDLIVDIAALDLDDGLAYDTSGATAR
jgi:hypothetical protein